jgi:hypothetical protein
MKDNLNEKSTIEVLPHVHSNGRAILFLTTGHGRTGKFCMA